VATPGLRRLDSIADSVFYVGALLAAWHLHSTDLWEYLPALVVLGAVEVARYIFDLWKFRREAAYHLWSSKLWAFAYLAASFPCWDWGVAGFSWRFRFTWASWWISRVLRCPSCYRSGKAMCPPSFMPGGCAERTALRWIDARRRSCRGCRRFSNAANGVLERENSRLPAKSRRSLDCRDVRSRAKWTVTASNRFAKSISYIARERVGWAVRITRAIVVVLLSTLAAGACTTSPNGQMSKGPKIIPLNYLPALAGDYFEQLSKETGRRYHIYIRLPESYSNSLPDTRYPVVYLLDGDSLFPILATEHLFLILTRSCLRRLSSV